MGPTRAKQFVLRSLPFQIQRGVRRADGNDWPLACASYCIAKLTRHHVQDGKFIAVEQRILNHHITRRALKAKAVPLDREDFLKPSQHEGVYNANLFGKLQRVDWRHIYKLGSTTEQTRCPGPSPHHAPTTTTPFTPESCQTRPSEWRLQFGFRRVVIPTLCQDPCRSKSSRHFSM